MEARPGGRMAVIDGATATTDPRGACYHLVFRWLDRSALYVPIVQRPRTWPFQGQNTGSNPVGDAIPELLPESPPKYLKANEVTTVPNPPSRIRRP
jgi:hypothetical protein